MVVEEEQEQARFDDGGSEGVGKERAKANRGMQEMYSFGKLYMCISLSFWVLPFSQQPKPSSMPINPCLFLFSYSNKA